MPSLTAEEIKQVSYEKYEREKCKQKVRYVSEGTAIIEAKHTSKKFKGPGMRHYFCCWCKGWHLAKDRPRK